MIREIQGKIRARFEDSKEIPRAVDVIPNRVGPPGRHNFKAHSYAISENSSRE